jgi:hypothetical protein
MKRDMDLIRQIALETAEMPYGYALHSLDDVSSEDFGQHVIWMQQAGLIDAVVEEFMANDPPKARVLRLTWDGCEFVDAIKDDTLWKRAKETVIKPSASFTFGILRDWLRTEIQQGLPSLRNLSQ